MISSLISFLLFFSVFDIDESYPSLSLSDCIRLAIGNNNQIKQAEINRATAQIAKDDSKNSYVPSLYVSNQNNLSTGRVLDPTTYQFLTNRTVFDMSAAIGGSLTLFSGFERPNTIKKANLHLQSALLETEKTKNDIALNVIALFLNIILDKESIRVCENKIEMLSRQEDVIIKKVELQAASKAYLLNIQSDITKAKVELVTAQKNLYLDKVSICELLQLKDWEHFEITYEDQEYETLIPHLWNISDVMASASRLPQIRQQEIALDIADKDIKITASTLWPSLKLNAGYGSTFSNARTRTGGDEYNFADQFKDNQSSYVTLSLNIPILSAISVSNSVKQKKMARQNAGLELERVKLSLDKEVKQAIVNANSSFEKYTILSADVEKSKETLNLIEIKYSAGAATYYDYQIAVGNLFQSEIQLIQTKFEYIFRTKIIDFYAGKPLYP